MKNPLNILKEHIKTLLKKELCFIDSSLIDKINISYNFSYNCFTTNFLFLLPEESFSKAKNHLISLSLEKYSFEIKNRHLNISLSDTYYQQLLQELLTFLQTRKPITHSASLHISYKNKAEMADYRASTVLNTLKNILAYNGFESIITMNIDSKMLVPIKISVKHTNIYFEKNIERSYIAPSLFEEYSTSLIKLLLLKNSYSRVVSLKESSIKLNTRNKTYVTAYTIARILYMSKTDLSKDYILKSQLNQYLIALTEIMGDYKMSLSVSPYVELLNALSHEIFTSNLFLNQDDIILAKEIFSFINNILETPFQNY